jgi:branched-chain amino acid transport system permease protein
MQDILQFAQILIAGLTDGAIYALVALGFSLVFAVSGYVNLMQGEFVVLGGLIAIALSEAMFPLPVVLIGAVLGTTVFAAIVQWLVLSPNRNLSADSALIITIGAALVARGVAMISFGKDPLSLSAFSGERPIFLGPVPVSTQSLWIAGTLLMASLGLWCFFRFTYIGKAMLACAQSPVGARLVGINLAFVSLVTFATSAALGALAGAVVAPLTMITFDEGLNFGIKGFIAAVFGTLGSFPGAVFGGLALGLMESFVAGYVSSQYRDAFTFCAVLLLLFVRQARSARMSR